jgi:ABC-2 type transport system permease protein
MRNIWTIARREYRQIFTSPIAYVFLFVILLTLGIFFYLDILYAVGSQQFVPGYQRTFQLLAFPLLFLAIPALTMRSVAEENKMGTLELMLTAPVKDWEFIIGKWFGSLLFFITIIAITIIYPLILNSLTTPGIDQLSLMVGYLGIILLASSLCALGVYVSSLFSNPIASLFASLGLMIVLWVIGAPAQIVQGGSADVFRYLSLSEHFYNTFLTGVLSLEDVVYYLSVTAIGLFLGTTSIELRRVRL